jgi:23S rRNA pseudouridine2605 synthase
MARQRLQKYLAQAGLDSRRKCEELILLGLVSVNGKTVEKLPAFVDPDSDVVTVEGRKIKTRQKVYYLLNKPKNVVCTNKDPQGRKKAIDLIDSKERIFCVGRLDADTTGLIILTNDSELTNRLTHPRYKVPKTYIVTVKGIIQSKTLEKLQKGIWLAEGKTAGASVKILNKSHTETLLEITIKQGLNRQIRRMLAKLKLPVKSLKRTKIGKISIKNLGSGRARPLTNSEISYLKKISSLLGYLK